MVLLYLPCIVISWLWLGNGIATVAAWSIAKPGCSGTCGDVSIPYPFGVRPGCYMNESFQVYCKRSKLYLTSINMELLDVSMNGYARINNLVISSNCGGKAAHSARVVDLSGSPFRYSEEYTKFTATGCDNYAMFLTNNSVVGACLSFCVSTNGHDFHNTTGCYGVGCCQTTIPPQIDSFHVLFDPFLITQTNATGCRTAFMVDPSSIDFGRQQIGDWFRDFNNMTYVPAVVQWGRYQGYCRITKPSQAFCSSNGYCWEEVDSHHLCVCSPKETDAADLSDSYIYGECSEDAKDCKYNPHTYRCRLLCTYIPGPTGYNCSCPHGYYSYYYDDDTCYDYGLPDIRPSNRAKIIIIGCVSGLGSMLLLLGLWWLYRIIKRRKEFKLKQKYFKRNGGLLLEQQLNSTENSIEHAKVFTSKDLEKATDNYHTNRIIGQGGQGTVYKGMLTDGKIVAIKKSKLVDESKLAEFINEVVILSQINHRNVVQLLGCCLETKVPLLVYEYISNGTLFHHLHNEKEEFPITWEMRLQIATEVANALSYLHSAAALPIYHRDIKSSNILLDEKYRAKVADFGISKSIAVDQTHVTTQVQGTFGYLDPEYFQSSQFTDKSDVYSFGVVLVELLTGRKPISEGRSIKERSLTTYFLLAMEDNHLFDILDSRVANEGGKKEIEAVAKLARGCLDLNSRKRPTMKMVAMELEIIRAAQGTYSIPQQDYEVVDYATKIDATGPWNATLSSTTSSFNVTWDATSSSTTSSFNVTASLLKNSQ